MIAKIKYLGNLRTEATHLRSGNVIYTDAPIDNEGKGEAFSPTDLAATSLGSCILTIMGIAARNHQINIESTEAHIEKVMVSHPRRIAKVGINIFMPKRSFSEKEKKILEKAAHHCPVALSLSPDTEESISFHWP
jgi:putative redox protein